MNSALARAQRRTLPHVLERKDANGDNPAVVAEIQREIRAIGDSTTKLKDSLEKDLAQVRQVAEEAKGAIGPEVKTQIDALTTSILEKQTALETGLKGRLSEIEKRLGRIGMGGNANDNEVVERKNAIDFHRVMLAGCGQLKASTIITEADVDFDGIKAWNASFPTYLRSKDDRAIEAKALQVGSNPDGGYWLPTAIDNRIITQVFETSPMRQLAYIETISTDALEIPNDLGEFDAGWVGEEDSRTETNTSQTGVLRIPVHEIYASPKATQKLLEDAAIDIEAWIAKKIADKFSRVEASAFINGNGIKKPRGILTYPAGTGNPGQIEQVVSGNATGITSDSLINVMIALKEPYVPGSTWLMRRATVGKVMLLKDGDGQYIWRAGLEAGKPSVLLGYPVMQAADMPAVGAAATPIAFGNFREGYTIVDRLGISTLRDPFTAKPFVVFYTRKRVGGDVTNFEAFKLMVIST